MVGKLQIHLAATLRSGEPTRRASLHEGNFGEVDEEITHQKDHQIMKLGQRQGRRFIRFAPDFDQQVHMVGENQ